MSDPFLVESSNASTAPTEWIKFRIFGQSFMLHQIRKLIGMVILMMKLEVSSSSHIIPLTLSEKKFNIPKAPGLGLLLDEVNNYQDAKQSIKVLLVYHLALFYWIQQAIS